MKKIILVLCLIFLIALISCDKISDMTKKISGDKEEVVKNKVEVKESFVVEDDSGNELKIIVK